MRLADHPSVLKATLRATNLLGRRSSFLASFPAWWLWFIPWSVPVSERGLAKQARWLAPTQPFALKTSGGRVAGFYAGDGPVVLLVHGWGERAASLGGFIEPLCAAGFRVVGVDLPAHGDSAGQSTNIIRAGGAMAEVANEFGGASAVIGHSMGANTALWAMDHGLQVKAAVFLAPNVDLASAMETFASLFEIPPTAIAGLKERIERRFGKTVWRDIRGDNLARGLEVPGLVFHDPADPQVPFAGSQRLVEAWGSATLVPVPGLGHGAITRDAGVIERAVGFVTAEAEEPQGLPRLS